MKMKKLISFFNCIFAQFVKRLSSHTYNIPIYNIHKRKKKKKIVSRLSPSPYTHSIGKHICQTKIKTKALKTNYFVVLFFGKQLFVLLLKSCRFYFVLSGTLTICLQMKQLINPFNYNVICLCSLKTLICNLKYLLLN